MTPAEGERAWQLADSLGVALVTPDGDLVMTAYKWTARLNRGAAYDSYYLALAERPGRALWTADRRLCYAVDQP